MNDVVGIFLFYQLIQYLKMKAAGVLTILIEECVNSNAAARN